MKDLTYASPAEVRATIRAGQWTNQTSGLAKGYAQASPIIMSAKYADDFLAFCQKNSKPFPLYGISEKGNSKLPFLGKDVDVKYDLPGYYVYRDGKFSESVTNLEQIWQDDFVTFAIGCSFSFEEMLIEQDVPLRHIEEHKNVSMYNSNIPLNPVGIFKGDMVVSMRPFSAENAIKAIALTAQFPNFHGIPVHLANPKLIGIENLDKPNYGDAVTINLDDVPVFWACGTTALHVMEQAKLPIAIVENPGLMLVTDILAESLRKADVKF